MRILKSALLCFGLMSAAVLRADQVILRNQDRMTGTVTGLADGKLSLSTEYAGQVEIDWRQVVQLKMERPLLIELQDGRQAESPIETAREGFGRGDSPSLPDEFALSDIVSIRKPAALETRPGWLRHWTGQAQLGYNVTRGNSHTDHLAVAFRPQRQTEKDRIKADYQLIYSKQDDSQVNSLQDGSLRYDRFLDSDRFFIFVLGGFAANRQQRLDLRTREGGGFGYTFQRAEETSFSIYGGVTAVQEKFEGLERDSQVQGLAGFEFSRELFGAGSFHTQTEYEPRFNEPRYLLNWDAQIQFPLFRNLTFGVEVFDKFNSNPQSVGTKKNDFGILSTFGWKF